MSQHPLPHARHQPYLLIPSTQKIYQEKQRTQKRDSTPHKSYRTALAYVKIKTLTLFQQNPQNNDQILMIRDQRQRKQIISKETDTTAITL